MTGTTKRIIGAAIAALLVVGLAGVALAAAGPAARPSFGLEESALALAGAEPDPAAAAAGAAGARAKRQELQACVKAKVDAGTDRKAALRECAGQLGLPAGRRGGGGKVPPLGRAAHADIVVPKKGAEGQWETIQVNRGKVTAVAADSLSLQRPDGPTVTVKVVAATKVKGVDKVTDLAVGREVAVVSAGGEARSVVARR